MQDIDWTPTSFPDLDLIDGSMVTFKCDEENRKRNRKKNEEIEFIEWFVNGKRIQPSWFDWRVSVSTDGKLGIWPIGVGDSGHFECLSNGQLRASVTVNVVSVSPSFQNVLIKGLMNYLFVCAVFSIVTISLGCLLGNRNQEIKDVEVDRMEEFLSENVFKTDQMAKEKVAKIIEQQNVVDERQLLENKAKSNRSTIMILLQNPKRENLKKKKTEADSTNPTASTGTITEGVVTTEEGTATKGSSDTNVITTNTTATTTNKTNDTDVGTTVTKTVEEEDVKDGKEEQGGDSDEDDDDVETDTTSKGSTATGKASKGKGKKKKATKGNKNTKKNKKKNTGKGKKNRKGSKGSNTKGTGKGPNKNTKNKAVAKPAKKKK
ncbi:hypothetical protein CRE_15583 [Caenorhabditis remanei]|uniref:Ig-like domain-containing protein n=1 Tax=Caenorhabditis remanei TaxID=31234 RepID=E3MT27_CAERE|nr:hypothetical protein CRE_15583 [Caenorhabditis remanei]